MPAPTPSGYSGTPLAKKLGYKPGCKAATVAAPPGYLAWLQPVPGGVIFERQPGPQTDLVHVFATEKAFLAGQLASLRKSLKPEAAVWVSWPKKASKAPTDITEDTLRDLALPLGFVDIKVCSINDIWSGLKLVVRQEYR